MAAARELAGYRSIRKFAAHLAADGFGVSTLTSYETGKEIPPDEKVRAFARLVDLPYAFFTIDYDVLATEPDDARATSLERRMARVEEAITLLADPALRAADRRQLLARWLQQGEQHHSTSAPEPPSQAAG